MRIAKVCYYLISYVCCPPFRRLFYRDKMAFDMARQRAANRKGQKRQPMVTVVHKANVLSVSDGLFRESALAVAKNYPDVKVRYICFV